MRQKTGKTYRRLLIRSVKATRTRFFSIMAIVAVGVGFLAGLLATTPDMQYTVDQYYDENRLFDLDVRGTMGVTDADAEALRALDSVEICMPAYVTDVLMNAGDGSGFVTRIYGVPLGAFGGETFLNGFELAAGRMPENASECLLASPNGYTGSAHAIGETYTISEENKEFDKLDDTYAGRTLTVVGLAKSPYYMSVESEPSTVGAGRVEAILYTLPDFYSLEVYTDLFLSVRGAAALNTFSKEYQTLIDGVADTLETLGEDRSVIRYREVVDEANEKLTDARVELADAEADAEKKLADARQELDEGHADLESGKREVEDAKIQVADARVKLDDAKKELDKNQRKVTDARWTLTDARKDAEAQFKDAYSQLEDARPYYGEAWYQAALQSVRDAEKAANAELDASAKEIRYAERKLSEGKTKVADAETELADAEKDIADAEKKIADAETRIADGEQEYQTASDDAEREIADAHKKIDDAQKDVDELETPEWVVTDRSDTVSYRSYKSNSEKIAAIAKVFPIFFFLVAALVALTTMTRMVEEERMQIGTLKALGYDRRDILAYYVGYSVLASLLGSVAGVFIGFYTLPLVISNAYTMMYVLPQTQLVFWWKYALIVAPVAVACTTGATFVACLGQLSERPAQLMLPRAPKPGKRVFLERIGFIWKRMKFTDKVTARNVFRYKKRLFMTVIGVAGCCALLLTGFGIRDSIRDIVAKQFGEIYQYNLSLYLSEDGAETDDPIIAGFLADSSAVTSFAVMHSEVGEAEHAEGSSEVTIFVPRDTDALKQQITLRNRKSGADIPFNEDSVVLTEKLAETLGVKAGDTVEIGSADGKRANFTVTGVAENYLTGYLFMSEKTYEAAYGETPEYKLVIASVPDESAETRDAVSRRVLESDHILLVQFSETIRESFSNTVKNIDYIVIVLIVSAGILAMIVLYNLTNINICERTKELATIKVLGFHEKEVASYIYRETNILVALGIVAGFGLGVWLHSFVVRAAEVDAVMFGRQIYLRSYLLAAAVTALFTALVDWIMLGRLKNIDMVESMKANE